MELFGGWSYESILEMVDSLVYDRRYGGFYDIITNFTVKELLEIFNVIHNRETKKELDKAITEYSGEGTNLPTKELSQEFMDFLMDN